MTMEFFSVSDKRPKDILYVQLASIKSSKLEQNTINYYLIIEDLDDKFINYFKDLEDQHFHVYFIEARNYSSRINPPERSYLYYVRCLAPSIFPLLDKIIYLDTDVVACNSGIEQLWNIDISNKSIAGAIDIEIQYNTPMQMSNVKKMVSQDYFNSGVVVMNLKRMRQNGIDKKMEQILWSWPHSELRCILHDQTILNYVTRGDVKIISTKWNNSILALVMRDQKAYKQYYQTDNLMSKINDAVLLHLKGPKPWQAVSANVEYMLLLRKEAQVIYGQIYKTFAKHQEF